MSDPKIVYPLSWEFGREGSPAEVIKAIALEMLSHRATLEKQANRMNAQGPMINKAEYKQLAQRADDLEKYAIALYIVAVQMDPDRYQEEHIEALLNLAMKYEINLPEWMKSRGGTDKEDR